MSPPLFKNVQWAVTAHGLEAIGGWIDRPSWPGGPSYFIAANRLTEKRPGTERLYDWPLHMAEKTWVDIDAFIAAFTKALELHKGRYPGTVNRKMLDATIAKVRRDMARE
jgi:hypothetical protein